MRRFVDAEGPAWAFSITTAIATAVPSSPSSSSHQDGIQFIKAIQETFPLNFSYSPRDALGYLSQSCGRVLNIEIATVLLDTHTHASRSRQLENPPLVLLAVRAEKTARHS